MEGEGMEGEGMEGGKMHGEGLGKLNGESYHFTCCAASYSYALPQLSNKWSNDLVICYSKQIAPSRWSPLLVC